MPPEIYQSVNCTNELPDSVRSNDIVLHDLYDANVLFNGVKSIIVNADGETVYNYSNLKIEPSDFQDPAYLPGTTVLLGVHGEHNYYHWNVDALPKLRILEMAGHVLSDIDRFVLWGGFYHEFHTRAFNCLGIPEEKVFLSKTTPNFRCERLLHVDIRNFVGMQMHSVVPEYLRSVFLEEDREVGNRKLFIARENTNARRITNQDEVLKLVSSHGFEVVYMEGLGLKEQAAMFNSASVIIGTHGAGLTNLVYCNPGTTVVELFGAHVYSFFYGLSNLCRLRYIPVLCSADDYDGVVDAKLCNAKSDQAVTIKADTTVNLAVLEKTLTSLSL